MNNRELVNIWIRKQYFQKKQKLLLKKHFQNAPPFPHLVLPNFFAEEKLLPVLQAVQELPFFPKSSDLFQFKQSADFSGVKQPALREFRDALRSPQFTAFLEEITGTKLKSGLIDLAASLYQDTDFLLCHDDRLENRALAFILYFSTLKKQQGGALCLYDAQEKLAKKITPRWNTFVIFQVSAKSLHAVEEVIKAQRLAVGGWYHGR
ncbi:MAG TPA: 2OG-Fe(II) oxygenase family protein [Candidatus Nanoarchaeia archaeon]|nr:2OG-Fe(II) oxygenase family protein [Candidatus Nanoarchaeia archaeon]